MTTALNAGELRGIFGPQGDSARWLQATQAFKNGVPRFQTKAEAEKFMVDYNSAGIGSNPSDPTLKHIFTMLTSWDQIEEVGDSLALCTARLSCTSFFVLSPCLFQPPAPPSAVSPSSNRQCEHR